MQSMTRYLGKEMIALVAVFAVALTVLIRWHVAERADIEARFLHEQVTIAEAKRDQVASTLTEVYQNIRTLTLLPSVRGIVGGNRSDEDEDIVLSGRFSEEGRTTVQQIYNNLASRVSVSEVYAVVEGLDAGRGWARRPFLGSLAALILGVGAGVAVWVLFNGANPLG